MKNRFALGRCCCDSDTQPPETGCNHYGAVLFGCFGQAGCDWDTVIVASGLEPVDFIGQSGYRQISWVGNEHPFTGLLGVNAKFNDSGCDKFLMAVEIDSNPCPNQKIGATIIDVEYNNPNNPCRESKITYELWRSCSDVQTILETGTMSFDFQACCGGVFYTFAWQNTSGGVGTFDVLTNIGKDTYNDKCYKLGGYDDFDNGGNPPNFGFLNGCGGSEACGPCLLSFESTNISGEACSSSQDPPGRIVSSSLTMYFDGGWKNGTIPLTYDPDLSLVDSSWLPSACSNPPTNGAAGVTDYFAWHGTGQLTRDYDCIGNPLYGTLEEDVTYDIFVSLSFFCQQGVQCGNRIYGDLLSPQLVVIVFESGQLFQVGGVVNILEDNGIYYECEIPAFTGAGTISQPCGEGAWTIY